jgi:hypothetical protein
VLHALETAELQEVRTAGDSSSGWFCEDGSEDREDICTSEEVNGDEHMAKKSALMGMAKGLQTMSAGAAKMTLGKPVKMKKRC